MAEFRRATRRILDAEDDPRTLWVTHTPFTDVMCAPGRGPRLELDGHHDWLLASDGSRLALFRIHGPRLLDQDMWFDAPLDRLSIAHRDVGELARRRILTVTDPESVWFAVSASLSPRGVTRSFSELLGL